MPETAGKRRITHTERAAYEVLAGSQAGRDTEAMFLGALNASADTAPVAAVRTVPRETHDDSATRRGNSSSLRRARARATRPRVLPVVTPDVAALTLTVFIPAHNEAAGLPETLRALARQTVRPDRVIVVDDGSTDGTGDIAWHYGAEVLRTDGGAESSGSKSKVINYGLLASECDTDLVLNVDGDTVICDTFVQQIKAPFADPLVAVAGGIVQVWNPKGILQRARQVEYLLGQHLYRPLQNFWASPTVCPGAACAYRRVPLMANGGFPDGTIAEDMDYTWRMMLSGYKAVYVPGAECYAIDPKTPAQLRTQLWRWMSGYYQCVRTHWREVLKHKKILALLVLASMWDVLSLPVWLATPLLFGTGNHVLVTLAVVLLGTDLLVTVPVVTVGAVRRGHSVLRILPTIPLIWVIRAFNFWYAGKALLYELVLVPCEWKSSLSFFTKGH